MNTKPARRVTAIGARMPTACAALLALAGCGGGDGGNGVSGNRAPTFTSTTTANFVENGTGTVYRPAASDPDGQTVQFAIAGGADANKFTMAAGELSFKSPPDYDTAGDANGDNVYEVEISASDGSATTTLPLKITVTNSKEGIDVRRIASGFVDAVAIAPFSGTLLLVAEASGGVYEINVTTGAKRLLTTITGLPAKGLLSITAANTYHIDGAFFALTHNGFGLISVTKYLRNLASWVPSNFGPDLNVITPSPPGGWLAMQGSSLLVGINDPDKGAQDSRPIGKLLRLDPNPDPYAGAASFYKITELAKGLHQPVAAVDMGNGWLVADRGTTIADEFNFLEKGKAASVNFGWPAKEGNTLVASASVPAGTVDPLLEIPRKPDGKTGQGVVGGAAAGATSVLDGQFVFADRGGAIYTVPISPLLKGEARTMAAAQRRDEDFAPDIGKIDRPIELTSGQAFGIFILDEDGEVFRVN